jgi:predicted amidophosphoribosyltransferase
MRAAARALRRAGAREIHAFVVARAEWNSSGS